MNQFDVVEAKFSPKITNDLKPGAELWIGRVCEWEAVWIVDNGPYEGEWAMTVKRELESPEPPPPFIWVPFSDLEIVK